jgi:hypothetical protein
MGVVAMEEDRGVSYKFQGTTIYQIIGCLYCDKCGSFNIGKRVTHWMLIGISIPTIITTTFWRITISAILPSAIPIVYPLCFGSILWCVSLTGIFEFGHRCKKCGNRDISLINVLNYPAYDLSVLDVPYKTTIKYYVESYDI